MGSTTKSTFLACIALGLQLVPVTVQAQSSGIVIDGSSIRIESPGAATGQDSVLIGPNGISIPGIAVPVPGSGSPGMSGGVGVSIQNDEVYIDGERVPPGVTRHTGRSGQRYVIERSDGAVSVRTE